MNKTWIIGASVGGLMIVALVIGIRVYMASVAKPGVQKTTTTGNEIVTTSETSLEDRVRELEFSLADVINQLKDVAPNLKPSSTTKDLENRVKTIEVAITDLQTRIKNLESGTKTTTTSTTSSTKPSTQIPLNWTGATTSTDWSGVGSGEVVINSADYPGATSFQFQANIKTSGSGGRAYARIFNKDDNSAIGSSELSTDATSYIFVTSGTFSMPNSRKTYYLQMKSTTDREASVQSAWVKVNY